MSTNMRMIKVQRRYHTHSRDKRPGPGRRALLKRAAGVAGLAFTGTCGTARAETYGTIAKTMVGYQLVPHRDEACGNCALFVPPGSQARCKAVAG